MKKILYLLIIFISLSVQGQIELTPLEICDIGNDGYEAMDLTVKIPEILEGEEWSDYTINFYETYSNAQDNQNPIMNPENYFNITPSIFTLYARKESWEGDVTLYSFDVILLDNPIIGQPNNLINPDGIFDLTNNSDVILNGNTDYIMTFHLTLSDAEQNVSAIENPTNFIATSYVQAICVRVENANGCFIVITFYLITDEDDIVYIPDSSFKAKLLEADPTNDIASNYNGTIKIDINNDGEIQISEALNVYGLDVSFSNISDATGIEAFINLKGVSFYNNQLTTINLNSNLNLITLSLSSNNLEDLIIDQLNNIEILYVEDNNLTELDLSHNLNLTSLNCNNNNLTELDLSNNTSLKILWTIYNPLVHLNIKNGGNLNPSLVNSGSWTEMWANLPNNILICADEPELEWIFPNLNIWDNEGQIITSYCSFEPEGNYNTITGNVMYDFNNDGCDETDITQFTKIVINDGTEQGVSYTNQNGNYIFFTQEGEYTLVADVENPTFFNVTPITETVTFTDNNNNEEIVNFCITPNGVHNDLEVVIAPINPARPGFEATYKIVYRNKGNQIMSEDYGLNFVYNQNLMTFISASVEPDSQIAGAMNWSYENLMPFESRSIVVTMQINPPTHPTYPVNIDDVLTFTSIIMPQNGDENVSDNIYIFNQTVVGAYDPNDITCLEGDIVDPEYIGEELHYLIRFENTGNYYAENVVIAMEINEELYDVSSLRVLNASHDVRAQVKDNVAEFFFNQIMLDSGGHGNILLVMRSHTALEEGDSVLSKADIYFDYNYPIITNDAVTLFQEELSRDNHELAALISIYPNPATDRVTISSETKIKSVEWYDLSGRLIRISLINDFVSIQDISSETEGIYIMKIQTEKGVLYHKIIKK